MLTNFKSYQLSKKLYFECEKIKTKDYLYLQLVRAASSVCLNLAEGSAKESKKDQKRFYYIALGSAREVQAVLELIRCSDEIRKLADDMGACIFGLCRK